MHEDNVYDAFSEFVDTFRYEYVKKPPVEGHCYNTFSKGCALNNMYHNGRTLSSTIPPSKKPFIIQL